MSDSITFRETAVLLEDLAQLAVDLASPDAGTRMKAVDALAAIGAPAVPTLAPLLYGGNSTAHAGALLALRTLVWRSTRPGAAQERQATAIAILRQTAASTGLSKPARNMLLELLSFVADAESVPALKTLLVDRDVREATRFVLLRIPNSAGIGVLLDLLPNTDAVFQVAIVNGLEGRGRGPAAVQCQKLVGSPEVEVRRAAITALARFADADNAEILYRIGSNGASTNRKSARVAFFQLAETLSRSGRTEQAAALYPRFGGFAVTSAERCAVLHGLVLSHSPNAESVLLIALKDPMRDVRGMAAQSLAELPGRALSIKLVAVMAGANPELRLMLITTFAARQDDIARKALMDAATDKDAMVRSAAFLAIRDRKDISTVDAVPIFVKALPLAETDPEREAIARGLERYGDPASLTALMDAYKSGRSKNAVIGALLAVADTLAMRNDPSPAISIYKLALSPGADPALLRTAAARLKKMGIDVDAVKQFGFIENWSLVGPIPGRLPWRTQDAISTDRAPDTSQPVAAAGRSFAWKRAVITDPSGQMDLGIALGQQNDVACYAFATIVSPTDADIELRIGSDDDLFCWLNGTKVYQFTGDRGWTVDQDTVAVHLKQGQNQILLKVLNGGGGWGFSVRTTDKSGAALSLKEP